MAQSLSTIAPDFDDLVVQFQNKLAGKPSWFDLLPSGTGQTLIEFISGVGELDQSAIERTFQEMFSETSRLNSTIQGITKMLGVRMPRKTPAATSLAHMPVGGPAPVLGGLKRNDNLTYPVASPYTISAYSQFSSDKGLLFNRDPIYFDAGDFFAYQLESDGITRRDISLFEGVVNNRNYTGTGTDFFSIISVEENFSIADVDVVITVNSVPIPRQTEGLWNNKYNVAGWQDITTSAGQLHCLFGSSGGASYGFGTLPASGDAIRLTYVVTKGSQGNNVFGLATTTCVNEPGLIDSQHEALINNLSGGADQRAASDYKKLGPRLFAADQGERAVNPQDYDAVAESYAGIIDARMLGQRETYPSRPSFMNAIRVVTYPKWEGAGDAAAYQAFLDWYTKKTMYSMRFWPSVTDIQQPGFVNWPYYKDFVLTMQVFCNNAADLNDVRTNYIIPAIKEILDQLNSGIYYAGRISRNIYRSDIIDAVKNSHSAIDYVKLVAPTNDVIADVAGLIPTSGYTGTPSNAGGTLLPNTTYYYYLTLTTTSPVVGETLPYGPIPVTTGPTDNRILLNWQAISSYYYSAPQNRFSGINIYGRTLAGLGKLNVAPLAPSTVAFLDDGSLVPGVVPPDNDSTGRFVMMLPVNWTTTNLTTNVQMYYSTRGGE